MSPEAAEGGSAALAESGSRYLKGNAMARRYPRDSMRGLGGSRERLEEARHPGRCGGYDAVMASTRLATIALSTLVLSCSGDQDPVLGGAGGGSDDSSAAVMTSSATGGEGGAGGAAPLDPEAVCSEYCTTWLACDDPFPSLEACQDACLDDIDTAALGGADCYKAYPALLQCIGGLACDDLDDWADPEGPCAVETEAVASDC